METSEEQIGEEIHPTEAEVSTAIKSLKAGKAPGEDDIQPKMMSWEYAKEVYIHAL